MTVAVLFLILALVCFVLAAFNLVTRISIGWLGMVFLTIAVWLIPVLK
jgi:hypothetical protein